MTVGETFHDWVSKSQLIKCIVTVIMVDIVVEESGDNQLNLERSLQGVLFGLKVTESPRANQDSWT